MDELDGVWSAMMEALNDVKDGLIKAEELGYDEIADEIDCAWHGLWKRYNRVLDMIDEIEEDGCHDRELHVRD